MPRSLQTFSGNKILVWLAEQAVLIVFVMISYGATTAEDNAMIEELQLVDAYDVSLFRYQRMYRSTGSNASR